MTKTAKIYGDSLYDLAAEEKLTEEILPQMEQVAVLFKENPDYLSRPSRKQNVSGCWTRLLKDSFPCIC